MDKTVIIVFLLMSFVSCNNKTTNIKKQTQEKLLSEADSTERKEKIVVLKGPPLLTTKFRIKDSANYSIDFLKAFRKYYGSYKIVSLIDDSIIINKDRKGAIVIPTDLPLNSAVSYKSNKNGKSCQLTVKRINYSSIEYYYVEFVKGNSLNTRKGIADLQPDFYLGAEATFEENGKTYRMNKYIDNAEINCWTYILIGVNSIEKSAFSYVCDNDKEMVNAPELIKQK